METTAMEEIGAIPTKTHLQKSLQKSTSEQEKSRQISYLVQQCFAIQDTYGKTPEQLKILMQMMVKDLLKFDIKKIEYAFNVWRQESEKIPTVASILKIIHGTIEKKPIKEMDYKSELTPEGKKFIENAFYEAKKLLYEGIVLNKPEGCPLWYGLSWKKIEEQGFIPQIEEYLIELERLRGKERAEGYLLYLKTSPSNYKPKNLYKH